MPPSPEHQGLAMLLLDCPPLMVWLLRNVLGMEVAERVTVLPGPDTVRELEHPDHHADGVVLVTEHDTEEREAFVLEVQLRLDRVKHWVWAFYVSGIGLRLQCPASLVVVTLDEEVERWCAGPFDLGRGRMTHRPWVLGPSNIPRSIDAELARAIPELAVLVVAVHRHRPGTKRTIGIALDAIHALRERDPYRAERLLQLLLVFSTHERFDMAYTMTREAEDRFNAHVLECLLATRLGKRLWREREEAYHRELEQELEQKLEQRLHQELEQRLQQEVRQELQQEVRHASLEALWVVLEARGLVPSAQQRERIEACDDDATLRGWLQRAATAHTVEDLF